MSDSLSMIKCSGKHHKYFDYSSWYEIYVAYMKDMILSDHIGNMISNWDIIIANSSWNASCGKCEFRVHTKIFICTVLCCYCTTEYYVHWNLAINCKTPAIRWTPPLN